MRSELAEPLTESVSGPPTRTRSMRCREIAKSSDPRGSGPSTNSRLP